MNETMEPLYEQAQLPIFQNRMYEAEAEAKACPKGDMRLVEDQATGLVYITGFDPTYEGSNPRVRRDYFAPGASIRAKGLILRHVLEHIRNPFDFLVQLKEANGGGLIYIELPRFDWICEDRAWFDVFYEHVNYFRISDFHRMFGKVIDSGSIFGGQYLYVVGDLATLRTPKIDEADRVKFPTDFTDKITKREPLGHGRVPFGWCVQRSHLLAPQSASRRAHRYGDRHQSSQAGQVSSGDRVVGAFPRAGAASQSTIYVMNSNYLDEIKAMSANAFEYVQVDHE
jgi:hypothetical protein